MPFTERKDAEAEVKKAEKIWAAAAKKSDTAREKYAELQRETNAAARYLAHVRTDPILFDDDPLTVVEPGDRGKAHGLDVGSATVTIFNTERPVRDVADASKIVAPPTPAGPPQAESQARVEPDEPPADNETPNWEQPAEPAAKPARKRRIAAKKPADQPPAPQVAPEQPADPFGEDDEAPPQVFDASGNQVNLTAPEAEDPFA